MPLKIRCPHCHRTLVAEDETAGHQKVCPACREIFNVPLPDSLPVLQRKTPSGPPPPSCPRCHAEVSPTASFCHRCRTDLGTGRRLPLKRRLRLLSWRFWIAAGLSLAGLALVVFFSTKLYLIRSRPAETTFTPTSAPAVATAGLAARLLEARDASQRRAALADLSGVELRSAPDIAAALAASLDRLTGDEQTTRNRIAAIDLLARYGSAHPGQVGGWLALLERCQQDQGLREAALRARAILADLRVREEITRLWLAKLERLLLLRRVIQVAGADDEAGASLLLRRAAVELGRCSDGLRAVAQADEQRAFDPLAEAYWESWNWLGQQRGNRLADEVFELARSPEGALEFRPEDVRQPRDVLRRVAERATPAARAAAGLILEQRGPQYRSLCRRIADGLAESLPEVGAADQQRLTWAITRLRGRMFGPTAHADPREVTVAEVSTALQWAHPDVPPALKPPYPAPPALACRAVTAQRLLERDLVRQLRGGWASATEALDEWLAAGLGHTPRIDALLDPGQRSPDYAGLTAAMIVVAASGEQSVRPQLELWREALDQPAWVRELAYTVLGALDARRGRWDSGWPRGLRLDEQTLPDSGQPGWEHFGRVLAAGGRGMVRRLVNFRPPPLSDSARARLLEAGRQAAGPTADDWPR